MLTVTGGNFGPPSQIVWNGAGLQTTFINSETLQTTITQQMFVSLGGAAGNTVQISVMSAPASGCTSGASSATLLLVIN